MERIPTLFSLAKRNAISASVVCPICEEEIESAEHLLVSCSFAQSVWCIIAGWCKVPPIFAFSIRDLLELYRFSCLPTRKAKVFHAVCLATMWCIWKARNSLLFERKPVRHTHGSAGSGHGSNGLEMNLIQVEHISSRKSAARERWIWIGKKVVEKRGY
ncbi:uncharacterized protein LOC143591034 [Bidens hawaiensis]|uniref:uncharacterized protein LOC143591034 n=1 Tax=Bidens hawaiensis TaxID=980011 RepID=UPI00404B6579